MKISQRCSSLLFDDSTLKRERNLSVEFYSSNLWIVKLGLTRSEAFVASALINGETVSAIAKLRRVSVATVRSQVRAIFLKANVTRQADLIRLYMLKAD